MTDPILEGLNERQREAATAVRGPVCILAGAGTGKTTTITRRVAYQIASGAFEPSQILAVTFTDRAAKEMRDRLAVLGVGAVRARTFHAEALGQLSQLGKAPKLLDSKARVLGPLVRGLPPPYKFRPTRDIASEIEHAKNRRIDAQRYQDSLDGHEPPIPADLMARVYREYEERKQRMGAIDFEDMLEATIQLLEAKPDAAQRVRARYAAFTVDEYQDVNLLQQTLLECWLGPRTDVCVVGDDYQSIFGFTGASPDYLTEFPKRLPGARVIALEDNYRSAPEVLEIANLLAMTISREPRVLKATRPSGTRPRLMEHATGADEVSSIVDSVKALAREGVPLREIAVLYRVNARSEDFEEGLARASIAYQVRDGAFLRRSGPRSVLVPLGRHPDKTGVRALVSATASSVGWAPNEEPDGQEEVTRQADLTTLVRLAEEFTTAHPDGTVGAFVADLTARFEDREEGRGVVLSTYHRAKGLEFDAVFLPRLEEREMPFALSKTADEIAEERRLLYVGITRAKRHLTISWARTRDGKTVRRSRFLDDLLPRASATVAPRTAKVPAPVADDPELFDRLRAWRLNIAQRDGVPPYVIFHDATLRAICERKPDSLRDLASVAGVGPTKLARYGADVLDLVRA